MTSADEDAFGREFRRLSAALERRPQSLEQLRVRAAAYFAVLKPLPLDVVKAKADAWLSRETKFPVPAEWLRVPLPPRPQGARTVLTEAEIQAYREAQARAFQGEPCGCRACRDAGVSHRFGRFVPDDDAEGNVPSMRLGGPDGVIVYAGHWAHGEELKRWYAARDRFYALKGTLRGPLASVFATVMRATGGEPAKVEPAATKETA